MFFPIHAFSIYNEVRIFTPNFKPISPLAICTLRAGFTRQMLLDTLEHLELAIVSLQISKDLPKKYWVRERYTDSLHALHNQSLVNLWIKGDIYIGGERLSINQFNELSCAFELVMGITKVFPHLEPKNREVELPDEVKMHPVVRKILEGQDEA